MGRPHPFSLSLSGFEMRKTYYVYLVFRSDGVPCYVGKGKGGRMNDSAQGKTGNKHLESLARKSGGMLPVVVLRDGLTEAEAFEFEVLLIRIIGRRDRKKGPLLNRTDGGEGFSGARRTGPKGKHWWHTLEGASYFAVEARSERDLPGRGPSYKAGSNSASMKGRKWFRSASTGKMYTGHLPREEGDLETGGAHLHNPEIHAKISKTLTGRPRSVESNLRQSEKMKGGAKTSWIWSKDFRCSKGKAEVLQVSTSLFRGDEEKDFRRAERPAHYECPKHGVK